MQLGHKLYVIVRKDLNNGSQACQALHAAIQFVFEHKEIARSWYDISNYVCLLEIANEQELDDLIKKADTLQLKYSVFREPDYNDSITAVAIEPSEETKQLCKGLKLALKT